MERFRLQALQKMSTLWYFDICNALLMCFLCIIVGSFQLQFKALCNFYCDLVRYKYNKIELAQ